MAYVWILLEITFACVKLGILDTTAVKVLYENFCNILLRALLFELIFS